MENLTALIAQLGAEHKTLASLMLKIEKTQAEISSLLYKAEIEVRALDDVCCRHYRILPKGKQQANGS